MGIAVLVVITLLVIVGYIFYLIIAFAVKRGVYEALFEFKKDILEELKKFREYNIPDDLNL